MVETGLMEFVMGLRDEEKGICLCILELVKELHDLKRDVNTLRWAVKIGQ